MAINELETFRKKNQTFLKTKIYETNSALVDKLPSYNTLVEYVDGLLKDQKYTQYVINYLLLYCQVRNADLNFDFVLFKRDTKNTNKNYLWFSAKQKPPIILEMFIKLLKLLNLMEK